MKRLYFIRHGLTEMNKLGLFSGITETPLTAEGRKQAKKAGQSAKDLGIDLIVSSPLERALETAQIIAKEIGYTPAEIQTNKLLIERHFGEMEGKPWTPDFNIDGVADIETDDSLIARAKAALRWIESLPADNILVVGHGSFGRALRYHLAKHIDFKEYIPNAEIVCWVEN
jgi:uncharacterized phosphatase